MTVWKPKGRNVWKYEFQIDNVRHSGSTRARSKKEALSAEASARAKASAAHQPQRSVKMTLGDAMTRYLSTIERQADYEGQRSRSRAWVDSLSSTASMEKITDVWIAERTERWLRDDAAQPRTVNNRLALLRRVYNVARTKWGVVAATVDWPGHFVRVKGKPRPLSAAEVQRWLEEVRRVCSQDDLDFAVFLLDTGARYGEAASLTWDRVDLNAGTIRLYRSKTDNESTIGLSDRLWAILRRRKEMEWTYVFGESHPRPHHASRSLRSTMDVVGINSPDNLKRYGRRTLHCTRDTFATSVVSSVGVLGVKSLLGHSDIRMSAKYAAIADGSLVGAVRQALASSVSTDTSSRPRLSLVPSVAALNERTVNER